MMAIEGKRIVSSLEDRLRKLEDRAAIQDLVAGYFRASDDDDYAFLADCFTRDARFAASGFDDAEGRDAIVALLRRARAGMAQTVHTPNYVHIQHLGPDAAEGVVCAHLELGMGVETYIGAVRYIDRYAREDGQWRLSARAMKVVHIGPWAEVASSLTTLRNVRWPGAEALPSDFSRPPAG